MSVMQAPTLHLTTVMTYHLMPWAHDILRIALLSHLMLWYHINCSGSQPLHTTHGGNSQHILLCYSGYSSAARAIEALQLSYSHMLALPLVCEEFHSHESPIEIQAGQLLT